MVSSSGNVATFRRWEMVASCSTKLKNKRPCLKMWNIIILETRAPKNLFLSNELGLSEISLYHDQKGQLCLLSTIRLFFEED
jgi:hypothetical protein